MAHNQRNRGLQRNVDKGYNYIYFTVFILITTWLLSSIFLNKNPTDVLQDVYYHLTGKQELASKSQEDWREILNEKNQEIKSLQDSISMLSNSNPYQTAIVNTDQNALNLRSDPSLSSEIVAKIPNGYKVNILYYDDKSLVLEGQNGTWVKVQYAEFEGWVWSNYLK